ncbi:MAG TPA: HAD family hydrolase [Acetobacteraceae bacterium]|nr:HAD family hydrolase [Acetobacteraceae bacterium]
MATDRWISFDCFGTLIDWHGGFRALLAPLAGGRTGELLDAYHRFERALEAERPHRLYREVLTIGLERAAKEIGLALPPAETDVLARRWGELPLYGDVPRALSGLRERGFRIGILTNCDDDLFACTLERFPSPKPDLVITAQQAGSYKPDLGHFREFERRTGVARGDWVHAACSWFHDIEPARRMGIARVWVDRDRTGDDPKAASRVLPDLADLPEVAATLAP